MSMMYKSQSHSLRCVSVPLQFFTHDCLSDALRSAGASRALSGARSNPTVLCSGQEGGSHDSHRSSCLGFTSTPVACASSLASREHRAFLKTSIITL
jgi:hypothetical protein